MSQKSIKERNIPTIQSSDMNPEIINEGYNQKYFDKEILKQDHIDNYSISLPQQQEFSKHIEVDIRDLVNPVKVEENKPFNEQTRATAPPENKRQNQFQDSRELNNNLKKEQRPIKNTNISKNNTDDDSNYKKIQKTKLFQKFMKEEIGNEISNKAHYESQPNLYENYLKSSKRKVSPAPNKKVFSSIEKTEGDQELAGYSQIFVPGAHNKMSSAYYPQQQKPQINYMDFATLPPNGNENMMLLPNNYYTPTKSYANPIFMQPNHKSSEETNEKSEVLQLQNKIVELQKCLNEEILKKTNLETALKEQQFSYDNLSKSFEEFKAKLNDQNNFYTEQRNQFEESHSKLTHRIFHLERNEENFKLEIEELRRKSLQDNLAFANKEEEIKDLYKKIEKITDTLREKDNLIAKKNDELTFALKRADEAKNEILSLKHLNERLEDKLRTQESTINSLSNEGDFSIKRMGEMKDKIQETYSENERLKFQVSSLQLQLNQKLIDQENFKNEIYQLKQNLLEKQQKEINLVLALEKANLQNNQLQKFIQKTEYNIEEQKNLNRNLVEKISDFATTANHSNFNNFKLLTSFLDNNNNRYDREVKPPPMTKPIQSITQGEEEYPVQLKKNSKGNINNMENLRIETKKPVSFNEKPKDIDYYMQDSFNDRDNRFKVTDFSNDMAAGSALGRTESGKKLFYDKFHNSNILSWDEKPHSYERKNYENSSFRNMNENKSFDNKNWNSMPNNQGIQKTTIQLIKTDPQNSNVARNIQEIDENIEDPQMIEKNLLTLQLAKQEMENELRKLEDAKIKTGANIKRKNELEVSLKTVDSKISKFRLKLRGLNSVQKK